MKTVLLSGKGIITNFLFTLLIKQYPEAVWTQPKLRWYQTQTRHELMIPDLTPEQVNSLGERLADSGGIPVTLTLC